MATDDTISDRVMAVFSKVVLVVDVTSLVALGVMAFYDVPGLRAAAAEVRGPLPPLTRSLLAIPPIVYAGGSVLLALILIIKESRVRPAIRLLINILALPPIVFTAIVLVLGLVEPVMTARQAMLH
jgi:hypothetical protein